MISAILQPHSGKSLIPALAFPVLFHFKGTGEKNTTTNPKQPLQNPAFHHILSHWI